MYKALGTKAREELEEETTKGSGEGIAVGTESRVRTVVSARFATGSPADGDTDCKDEFDEFKSDFWLADGLCRSSDVSYCTL